MESKRILLVGGGGHCRSVLDCLLNQHIYDEIGIVERANCEVTHVLSVPVVGADEDLPDLYQAGWTHAFITLGSIGNSGRRQALYGTLRKIGFTLPAIVDPSAVLGRDVVIQDGVFVGKGAVVNTGTRVGCCAIINTGAILEHDCIVGDFAHISPGCTLCGQVQVGKGTHVGAGSVVRQQIQIQENCVIGAGSVVVRNIVAGVQAYGNPCEVVKSI